MSKQFAWYAAIAMAGVWTPVFAQDSAEFCEATGHYYEAVAANAIGWEDARDAASMLSRNGVQGHLATITSAGEDACVDQIRANRFDTNGPAQVWIGGFQTGTDEPGGGWEWLNGEGSIPGTDSAIPYADWADTEGNQEPNDLAGVEQHLASGRFGLGLGWNDEGTATASILGYVVEFGDTVDAQDCLEGNDGVGGDFGCNITGAMNLELEDNSTLPPGSTVTQNLLRPDEIDVDKCPGEFAFPDPRVGTNGRPIAIRELDVFAELGGGPPGKLILDAHTYGSPCFAVIQGGANFELIDTLPGTGLNAIVATTTQMPESVPGIGNIYRCFGELGNNDLQTSIQSTYQTDDRNLMVEMTAAAMTNHCNSPSRQATFKFSYYVLNTHEDCGLDIGIDGAQAIHACFRRLAVAKFDALDMALDNTADNLQKPKFSTLNSQLNQAKSMIKARQYAKAHARLSKLLQLVNGATWIADEDNDAGNLVMRITNLLYRIEQLQAS